jgi:hydroxypyruvate reductase/glycerate 2-kinase
MSETQLREQARAIFDAAVAAAEPIALVVRALSGPLGDELRQAKRIVVVGAGKAGAAMAAGFEQALPDCLDRVEGIVNVPQGSERPLHKVKLHAARPAGSNQPTADGVAGAARMLELVSRAGPDDLAVCLISGGGSALLPLPVEDVSLEEKQVTTRLLHACGASINEMNAVRKHLSRIKGGRLAQAFQGRKLVSLIISDVVGDPLDVIASGPTAPDPTRFVDALDVLKRFDLLAKVPAAVVRHLETGAAGKTPETPKSLPDHVSNVIIGSNSISLTAARKVAESFGFRVLNLGAMVEGETREVAIACAGIVRSILRDSTPLAAPACLLFGGETTVTLGSNPGKGGRNQEFVLAMIHKLGARELNNVVVLSGGTDGEDGPTDAAGAIGGASTLMKAAQLGLNPGHFLESHDAYSYFQQTGDLVITGLTGTNVMDIRLVLIERSGA